MPTFDDAIARATARLRRDRELHGEVQRELRDHLDTAAAEFRAADYPPTQADEAALQAFGDPDELADDLWAANAFRLKLRAWAWWAARLTLLPAGALAVAAFVISGVTAIGAYQRMDGFDAGPLNAWQSEQLRSRMTTQQQLIYFGDESAPDELGRWTGLRDAFPDNPLYQLQVIDHLMTELRTNPILESNFEQWPERAASIRAELEIGDRIDPDNGIYELLDGALHATHIDLADASVTETYWRSAEDGDKPEFLFREPEFQPVVVMVDRHLDGELRADYLERFAPTPFADRADIDAALAALHEAAQHPYLTMRVAERVAHRLDQLPPPRSLLDVMFRLSTEIGVALPSLLPTRHLASVAIAEALRLAEAGDPDAALAILDDLSAMNAKLAASSDVLIELFVAQSLESHERIARVGVWQLAGDEAKAAAALAEHDALMRFYQREWRDQYKSDAEEDAVLRGAGVLMGLMMPAVPGFEMDFTPFRLAEHTLVDRAALTFGLCVLLVLAALAALLGGWSRVRRGDDGAMLLWVGWTRFAAVIALAVGGPVLGFGLWSVSPWSPRKYGIDYMFAALAVGYVLLAVWIVGLLWRLGGTALRERARQVGLSVPTRRRPPWTIATLALLTLLGLIAGSVLYAAPLSAFEKASRETLRGIEIGMYLCLAFAVLAMLLWIARQIVWARGLSWQRGDLRRMFLWSVAATVMLGLPMGGAVLLLAHPADHEAFLLVICVMSMLAGVLVGLFWLAHRPSEHQVFAASLLRSISPVVTVAALLLAVGVGSLTVLRERSLARQIVGDQPVLWVNEVEKSQGKVIRAYLAGDAPRPPARVPRN